MKWSTLVLVVPVAAMIGGVAFFSRASDDDNARRAEPIPFAELTRRSVIGRLGHPLGAVVTIEGTVADGSFTRAKLDDGETLLRVRAVNGQRLKDEQIFHFEDSRRATDGKPKVGATFKYIGYETGGFTGVPGEAFKYIGVVATTRYAFTTDFVILRDEQRGE